MNRNFYLLLFFGIIFLSSCVPNKDLIYLQDNGNSTQSIVSEVPKAAYRLQESDVLSINISAIDSKLVEIFNPTTTASNNVTPESFYYRGYIVDAHGNIDMPILNQVSVIGLTTEEAKAKIEGLLLKDHFKKEAQIFVNLKLAGFRYTINGEISEPGTKNLSLDRVTILEAIANAGDITVTGNRKDIQIIRKFPQGFQTYTIDLTDKNALQSPNFYLQPNDYVYIKPLKQKSWGTGKTGVESLTTIITVLTLVTTTFLLLRK